MQKIYTTGIKGKDLFKALRSCGQKHTLIRLLFQRMAEAVGGFENTRGIINAATTNNP